MSSNETPSLTYILPTVAWVSLLPIVAHDAPAGAVIEVHTAEMLLLAQQALQRCNCDDVEVRLVHRQQRGSRLTE
jgi:hypothetical protein